jgi:hypothetical protein
MKTYMRVQIPETAADWELFTGMNHVGAAAIALTSALEYHIKSWFAEEISLMDISEAMSETMWHYKDFGASDSEPRYHLNVVLRRLAALSGEGGWD